MYRLCIGYVSVMYRLCIGYVRELSRRGPDIVVYTFMRLCVYALLKVLRV